MKRNPGNLVTVITILVALSLGHTEARAGWEDEETRTYPPSRYPDWIVLTWVGDPATSQAVTWRTDSAVKKGYAEIAPADPSPDFTSEARRFVAYSTPLETESGVVRFHSAEFTGLQPQTLYIYRVGSEEGWSEWFQFRTASRETEPFSFLYFGDGQDAIHSHFSRTLRAAYRHAPDARFMLFAGDLVSRANKDGEWGGWHAAGGWIHATLPVIPSPGNHDRGKVEDKGYQLSRYWRPQFTLPKNGPAGLEETAYFVDYQGIRVISLDSNTHRGEQAEWLGTVLAENPNRWTVCVFHHPIFSSAKERDNPELRDLWKPIFDHHHVDLVLQGHDHAYARGRGLAPGGDAPVEEGGTVYVVSVSGPKQYELTEKRWMDRAAENTQLYQVIAIDADTLRYQAFTTTDELYDAFDLVKVPQGRNLLIDRIPKEVPERRFDTEPAGR